MATRFLFLMGWLLLLPLSAVNAQDAGEKPAEAIEKHKVGKFTLDAPGAPAKVYLQAAHDYGAEPKAEFVRRARKGELKWIVSEGTDGVTYQVIVPKSYEPGKPHGVVVFISAGDNGNLPGAYHALLEKHHLIAIGANKSGNKVDTLMRHSYAVHAVEMLDVRYDLDPDRIYVSGGSGGGRVTSQVMIMNSNTFTGGIPLIGANACISMTNADSKGNKFRDPGMWKNSDRSRLSKAGKEGRFVFITGDKDYNRANVKSVYEGYKNAGFRNVHYIEQKGLGHALPSAASFEQALEFVDAPLIKDAEKNYKAAQGKQKSNRLDDALLLYRKAAMHGRDAEWVADALEQVKALEAEYDAAIAVVEEAIKATDNEGFRKGIQTLRRSWSEIADRNVIKELTDRFAEARRSAS